MRQAADQRPTVELFSLYDVQPDRLKGQRDVKYGFVGAGHAERFRKAIEGLREGDVIGA